MTHVLPSVLPGALLVASLSLAAASHAGEPPPIPEEKVAPFPFDAEQIRAATQVGRRYEWLVKSAEEGESIQVTEYVRVDALGAAFRTLKGPVGGELKAVNEMVHTWGEIAAFAKYPAESTTIDEVRLEQPAGTFDCIRYTTHTQSGDKVLEIWYAKDLPGAPIRSIHHRWGTELFSLTLLSFDPDGNGPESYKPRK